MGACRRSHESADPHQQTCHWYDNKYIYSHLCDEALLAESRALLAEYRALLAECGALFAHDRMILLVFTNKHVIGKMIHTDTVVCV